MRASDADREQAVIALREHHVSGRLTLSELVERVERAYLARTHEELDAVAHDLPAPSLPRRRRTRVLLSLFGARERAGRLRVPRRAVVGGLLGAVDLDLRDATFESDVVTVFVAGALLSVDVHVPEGVEVETRSLFLLGGTDVYGDDKPIRPGTPLVRICAFGLLAAVDVHRGDAAKQPARKELHA